MSASPRPTAKCSGSRWSSLRLIRRFSALGSSATIARTRSSSPSASAEKMWWRAPRLTRNSAISGCVGSQQVAQPITPSA